MEELNRSYLENKYGRGTLQSLRKIDINEIGIERIESRTFNGLTRLEFLTLVNTQLTRINGELFDDLLNLIELWLYNNRLIRISWNTFSRLTSLRLVNLENNIINNLDENCFENLPNLKSLMLNRNKLKIIRENTFKGLTNLTTLWLHDNEIVMIDVRSFETLLNLEFLWLGNNRLVEIKRKCFECLSSIKVIEVYENHFRALSFKKQSTNSGFNRAKLDENGFLSDWNFFLKQFPVLVKKSDSFSKRGKKEYESEHIKEELNRKFLVKKFGKDNLINLTRIEISCNEIRKIDSNTFIGLIELKELSLINNQIEEIKVRSFESLSKLEVLNLDNNKLKRIYLNTFIGLTELKHLSLSDNDIEEIDFRSFESLSNLRELYLYYNELKRIDSNTLKDLTKLEILYLFDNEIEEIEVRSFESLSNLKELRLDNNKLKRIDSNTFNGLIKLEKLSLKSNEIKEIDVKLFESLTNLIGLWFNNNKLKSIDSNTFKRLANLKELELRFNEIEEIGVRLFESLSNLKELRLDNNKLKRIDTNTLKGLTNLERLDLNNNKIEEIDEKLFESLSNLKKLDLSNNKLKEIDRKCFEPLKSIQVIEIYENVGLNALPFIIPSTGYLYDEHKKEKYGSISEWNKFLQQFPRLEKDECERERESFDRLKIEEEGKGRSKQEQENVPLSSSSLNTIKEIDKEIQDPYIGLFLNDRYKIKEKIGKGSFGWVYLVDDTRIDIERVREKAMKIMDQLDSVTENELELFSRINHENIVKYLDHFHKRINKTFLITEYCQKGDLRKKIDEAKISDRNFEERQILDWMRQATNALKYLHSRKPDPIIHRDIKPENMLLSVRDEIKLADLGTSKLMENTHASTHAGTPPYMSPEMFNAQFMDTIYYPNTDIWSLGCVLFELKFLTFAFPEGQRNDPPVPSNVSISGIFSSILPKMLKKDCLVRITSQPLFTELLNLSDSISKS